MSINDRAQLAALMAQLKELWDHLNTLFEDLNANAGWERKHGLDWTFADVPYHLAYCNRDIVVRGLEVKPDAPAAEQELLATAEAVNAWNARKFAERSSDQTVSQSLFEWRASCQEIRELTASMTDADLVRPGFLKILRGWGAARDVLDFARSHDWSEFMQLRIHMGRADPVPNPEITRSYLQFVLGLFPMFLNKHAAAGRDFADVYDFSDPGIGAWTIHVTDGVAVLSEGAVAEADLVMTQSVETFEKTLRRIHDPVEAIQSGEIQVSDFESLGLFGQLFPV